MSDLDAELRRRLATIQEEGLFRQLRRVDSPQSALIRVDGHELINFSSNDYLGLANHPELKQAAIEAVQKYGAGSGGSRLICGSLAPHHQLEEILAEFKGTEAALTFSTGYAAALGTICALVSKPDLIILDRLVHASIVDAARLSGAKIRVFAHNDLDDLERILAWAASQPASVHDDKLSRAPEKFRGVLIVTESVFSMDGDRAPLRQLVELKEKHGAWLLVDEAHATGLFGPAGGGLAQAEGLGSRIEVQMGTLGKALGASGGFIAGSRALINYLVNRARCFIFSTAPVPAASAAASAAVRLVQGRVGEERRRLLWARVAQMETRLASIRKDLSYIGNSSSPTAAGGSGTPSAPAPSLSSAILPFLVGDESIAVQLANALRDRGFFVPAVRYPTVARRRARLRITLTAEHESSQVDRFLTAVHQLQQATPALS